MFYAFVWPLRLNCQLFSNPGNSIGLHYNSQTLRYCGPRLESNGHKRAPRRQQETGTVGRFPFSQNFRNFRFGGRWNTFRRFVPQENSQKKRWSRFPGWNFRTECRVPFTFLVVCTSSRSTVGHPATYRGLRPNGTTFYQSEIPLLLPPKFPGFFRKWKAPVVSLAAVFTRSRACWLCSRRVMLQWQWNNS